MMRDLQEFQAEVFRRSEKRIKERKKRRTHALMLCIPLVLCLTTVSGFLLSGHGLTKSADEAIPVHFDFPSSLMHVFDKETGLNMF